MWRSRRRLWIGLAGFLALAAAVFLVLRGMQFTRLLEQQAAVVMQDSAARDARARVPEIERALRLKEEAALAALARLPADPAPAAVAELSGRHPLVEAPFLLAADRSLAYPPPPGPALAALAAEEAAPDVFLSARRLLLSRARQGEATAALASVAAAPDLAVPWRIRARAAIAAAHLRAGRAEEAASAYAGIETDFPKEMREAARPSWLQLQAARLVALEASGHRGEAQALVAAVFRDLSAAGTRALGSDDAAVLLGRAALLAPPRASSGGIAAPSRAASSPSDPAYEATLGRFTAAHAAAARALKFGRMIEEWMIPRIARGSEPSTWVEELGGERYLVAWSRGEPGSGLLARGFLLRDEAVAALLDEALAGSDGGETPPGTAPGEARRLPLRAVQAPPPPGFQDLAALPGPLHGFLIGLDRSAWEGFLGTARRPFRIAAALIAALGVFLALSAGLGLLALRREMALSRLKTEFVANVSHELKTPLSLIRLFGETLLLDRVREPAKAREYYAVITRESERLTHLVDNMLDFASIEAGRKSFDLRPTDLGQVVEDTLADYRLSLEERGFVLTTEVAPRLPAVLADAAAVSQALLNLLDNAVKYAPSEKEIRVRVDQNGRSIRVAVADRGIGIASAEKRKVFETFYRSPAARRLGTRGSGLGLTLVRHIMTAHGGAVELESRPGEGSTFTLVFPVRSEAPGRADDVGRHTGREEGEA